MRVRLFGCLCGSLLLPLAANAEMHMLFTGGLQMLKLENDLSTELNTSLSQAYALNGEIFLSRGRKGGGGLSFGLRASYLTYGVATDDVTVSYVQMPIYLTVGKQFGGKGFLSFRPFVGAGWMLSNSITYDGSGTATDGTYAGSGFTSIFGLQIFMSLLGKSGPRLVLEGGYVYSLMKVMRAPVDTADDLDGDPSGLFGGGGLEIAF